MLGKGPDQHQSILFNDLKDLLDPKQPLYRLAQTAPWAAIEASLADRYAKHGRPAKPIRLMVGLLMLQRMFDLSDEAVVEHWRQNPYYQFFCGMRQFMWELPCDPSDLVHFRKRIGPDGAEEIFRHSVLMSGKAAETSVVLCDTTAQEKAVTYPRDRKLYRRVAESVLALASAEGIRLRRTYRRTIRRLARQMITGNFPRGIARARRAERRMRIIAGRLLRETRRKLPVDRAFHHLEQFDLWQRALRARRTGEAPVYSLHEPQIYAIKRGKDGKDWEFGTKVAITLHPTSGVILGALNLARPTGDLQAVPEILEQLHRVTGSAPAAMITDKGFRGQREHAGTLIYTPADLAQSTLPDTLRRRLRQRFRRRAAIEPTIGHLKSDHRLIRNHLKGWLGDEINVLLAAAGWNLRRLLRRFSQLVAHLAGWMVMMLSRSRGPSGRMPRIAQ